MKLLLIINNNIHWQKLALSLSSQQLLTQQDKNINHHDHSKMAAEKRNHFMFKQDSHSNTQIRILHKVILQSFI